MSSHKNLDVWKLSVKFVTEIYQETSKFPKEEMFGITSQMRRSAVSIASNIAEGAARQTDKEYVRFLYYSLGSKEELDTQLIIAQQLNYITQNSFDRLSPQLETIGKLLNGLIKYLKTSNKTINQKK